MVIAMPSDFGKPRPALMIQVNQFSEHASAMVLPVTRALLAAPLLHVMARPSAANGLRKPARMMMDKAMTVKRGKAGAAFGRLAGRQR